MENLKEITYTNDLNSNIFGWSGAFLCILFYLSPLIKIKKLCQGFLAYNQIPRLLLIFSFLNTLCWVSVQILHINVDKKKTIFDEDGIIKLVFTDPQIIGNLISMIICIYFIICWLFHVFKSNKFKTIIFGFLIVIFAFTIIMLSFLFHSESLYHKMNCLTSTINTFMFLSTFEHIQKARQKCDTKFIQLNTCLAMFSQSLIWFLYSLNQDNRNQKTEEISFNLYLFIPNLIGILTALLNFYFFVDISVKSKLC